MLCCAKHLLAGQHNDIEGEGGQDDEDSSTPMKTAAWREQQQGWPYDNEDSG